MHNLNRGGSGRSPRNLLRLRSNPKFSTRDRAGSCSRRRRGSTLCSESSLQLTELTLAPAAAISGCWALLRPHRQRALRATKCPTGLFSILSRRQKSPLPCCTRGEAACTPDRFFGSYQRSLALPCAAGCCLASERALTPSSRLPPAGGSLRETYATIYERKPSVLRAVAG